MASKRAQRRRECGAKRKYDSHKRAYAAMLSLHGFRGYQGLMTVYRCRHCGQFHFGHAPAFVRRAVEGK